MNYIIYLLRVSYLTSHTCRRGVPSTSTLKVSPKHTLLIRMEGWGRDERDLEVLAVPRAKNMLLWRIFL